MSTSPDWDREAEDRPVLWGSVIDASCRVTELQVDAVRTGNRPSYLTEFVLRREKESPTATSDLETALGDSE